MEAQELLKRIRKIDIHARGLTQNIFAGEYHSAFKGKGMMFSEVRNYQFGDEIRNIHWKVTARYNQPYIKEFEEERELTVMLLIDVSGSSNFGTKKQFKRDQIVEIAAVLAFSAIENNDKIGVLFFSDIIEKYIPPKKGKKHILFIIRELINFEPSHNKTNLTNVLKHLTNGVKKKCTAFLISDFMADEFENALMIASRKHDLVALQIYDGLEKELPAIGLIQLKDAETNEKIWINTSRRSVRKHYADKWKTKQKKIKKLFAKANTDLISMNTEEDFVPKLKELFKMRVRSYR